MKIGPCTTLVKVKVTVGLHDTYGVIVSSRQFDLDMSKVKVTWTALRVLKVIILNYYVDNRAPKGGGGGLVLCAMCKNHLLAMCYVSFCSHCYVRFK